MPNCTICATAAKDKRPDTPYWVCPNCDLWFQFPSPPKIYCAEHEGDPAAMNEHDKIANKHLADWLFRGVMGDVPGKTIDVGAKYPVLAKYLGSNGCNAWAIDGDERIRKYSVDLGVIGFVSDFESPSELSENKFDLITLVHVFEHFYNPLSALHKLRLMVSTDGAVFIRSPDHRVPGIERDLTDGHYSIHPYVHTLTSILQALAETRDMFYIDETYALVPGQRDYVLRPI